MARSEAEDQGLALIRQQTVLIESVTAARNVGDTAREARLQQQLADNKLQMSRLGT